MKKPMAVVLCAVTPLLVHAGESDALRMLPENVSTYGGKIDHLYYTLMALTGTAGIAVLCSLVYFCIRYRHKVGTPAHYTHGNSWGALGLSGSLALMVFVAIDMNTVRLSNAAARESQHLPDEKNAIRIQVLAQQFAWSFRYAGPDGQFGKFDLKKSNSENLFGIDKHDRAGKDDVQIEGVVCIPVNRPVIFEIRSKDVIHSFFLPNFRIKQDAMPGMKNSIWVQATRTGDFDIACTEMCGMMHSQMAGRLLVKEQKEYEQWLKDQAQ